MRFAKFALYSTATSCWNQYSCSKDMKFVINSLRFSAGTISLKKIGPTLLRRESDLNI